MKWLLLAVVLSFALLAMATPVAAVHGLPNDCALSPIPDTYEAPQDRVLYLLGEELAAYNMIAPSDPFFGTANMEVGPRSNRSTAAESYIPPTLLKALSVIESNMAHADHSVYWGAVGPTKVSFDCGHGIMQITSGMIVPNDNGWPSGRQALVATHYLYNIARGAAILVGKWNAAPEARPIVGNGDPRMAGDWYFALWSYNGFTGPGAFISNHPMDPQYEWPRTGFSCGPFDDGYGHSYADFPFQELVYGCAARPRSVNGAELWEPLDFPLPDLSDPAWSGPLSLANFVYPYSEMDMPTPLCAGEEPTPTPQCQMEDPTAQPPGAAAALVRGLPVMAVTPDVVVGDVNQVIISNVGQSSIGSILAWRARPNEEWLSVDKQAGVALEQAVTCTPGYPCERTATLTITVDTALAPASGEGTVTLRSLTTGQTIEVHVRRRTTDHFYTTSEDEPEDASIGGQRWEGVAAYISPEPRAGWVELYRLWNPVRGDHFYTTNVVSREAAALYGYRNQGVAGYVASTSAGGLVPLYQLWNGTIGDHFYTTSAAVRDGATVFGYRYERVAAYVSPQPDTGLAPFYRWWNGTIGDHLYTLRSGEPAPFSDDLYRFDGVAAYIAPDPLPDWVPLYRLWNSTIGDHFYTASVAVRDIAVTNAGYQEDGVVGYVSPTPADGLVPLYEVWNRVIGDHLYTTSVAVRDGSAWYGYENNGVIAYVAAEATPGLVPLFRWWLR